MHLFLSVKIRNTAYIDFLEFRVVRFSRTVRVLGVLRVFQVVQRQGRVPDDQLLLLVKTQAHRVQVLHRAQ